jgi:hypothetical protein
MMITTKLTMDLQSTEKLPAVCAVQSDCCSRKLEVTLLSGKKPFFIPADAAVVVHFKRPDGKGGEYDTMPDGSPAWQAEENTVTVTLAPQVLAFPGMVELTISICRGTVRVNSLPIGLLVYPMAKAPLEKAEADFRLTHFLAAPLGAQPGEYLQVSTVDENGKVLALVSAPAQAGGQDGVSPIVTIVPIPDGNRLTVTDADGTKYMDVLDGADGMDGADGKDGVDGVSPTLTVTSISNGHRLTIADADGTKYVDIPDGADGKDGANGKDGADGKTPVKGTDYFTAADKAEMVNAVIAALPVYAGEVV